MEGGPCFCGGRVLPEDNGNLWDRGLSGHKIRWRGLTLCPSHAYISTPTSSIRHTPKATLHTLQQVAPTNICSAAAKMSCELQQLLASVPGHPPLWSALNASSPAAPRSPPPPTPHPHRRPAAAHTMLMSTSCWPTSSPSSTARRYIPSAQMGKMFLQAGGGKCGRAKRAGCRWHQAGAASFVLVLSGAILGDAQSPFALVTTRHGSKRTDDVPAQPWPSCRCSACRWNILAEACQN